MLSLSSTPRPCDSLATHRCASTPSHHMSIHGCSIAARRLPLTATSTRGSIGPLNAFNSTAPSQRVSRRGGSGVLVILCPMPHIPGLGIQAFVKGSCHQTQAPTLLRSAVSSDRIDFEWSAHGTQVYKVTAKAALRRSDVDSGGVQLQALSDERRFVCGLKHRWRGCRHLEMDARETAPRKGSN